jgi:hypothetical protein
MGSSWVDDSVVPPPEQADSKRDTKITKEIMFNFFMIGCLD